MTEQSIPAGFYDDGSGTQRYWDGAAWGATLREALATQMPPAPVVPPGPGAPQTVVVMAPPSEKWSGLAIAGFVMSFFWITGIPAFIMCIVALRRIARSGERGRGLATAGAILSAITGLGFTLILVVFVLGSLIKGDFSTTSSCISSNGTGC